jgi:hypothetical protein
MSGQPGRSGGARPKSGPKPQEIREQKRLLCEKFFPDAEKALAYMVEVMNNPREQTTTRMAAGQIVMDQVWGKPKQAVDLDVASKVKILIGAGVGWKPN